MKIFIIIGTRPEIIKMSPIILECKQLGLDYFVLYTGQHRSYNMSQVFFKQLKLPQANCNLSIKSSSPSEQIGRMIIGIGKVLQKENPDVVLVQGDTNTALAGALATKSLSIKLGHVEAGLRSYDEYMPEETNRILIDHCSDLLFAPTKKSYQILCSEGISKEKIFVTGNTIVDAIYQIEKDSKSVLNKYQLQPLEYFLATIHRQENINDKTRFKNILKGLQKVAKKFNMPVVYPAHPHSYKNIKAFNLKTDGIKLINPVDFLTFLKLETNAKLVFTDSGGVQEEACILRVPCVTLRNNTERPETIEAGTNILAGTSPSVILGRTKFMLGKEKLWGNPFGDGGAGKRIVKILIEEIK